MVPNNVVAVNDEVVFDRYQNNNYKMNIKKEDVKGYVDNIEAMPQVIYKILNTQRYQYMIYSWNYGIELDDLLGEDVRYVCSEIEYRVKEALLQDDRITEVHSFTFDTNTKKSVLAEFVVETIFGSVESSKVVNY